MHFCIPTSTCFGNVYIVYSFIYSLVNDNTKYRFDNSKITGALWKFISILIMHLICNVSISTIIYYILRFDNGKLTGAFRLKVVHFDYSVGALQLCDWCIAITG